MNFIMAAIADNFIQLVTILGGLVFIRSDHIMSSYVKRIITIILVMIAFSSFFEYVDTIFSQGQYVPFVRETCTYFGYILKPGIFMIVNIFFFEKFREKIVPVILEIINIIICSSIFFSPVVVSFDSANNFQRGPLGYFPHIIGALLLVSFIFATYLYYRNKEKGHQKVLVFIIAVLLAAAIIDTFSTRHVLNSSIAICAMLYYFYIYMQKLYQVKQEQDEKLRMQRDELMTSQIQPHFIYNTLNTIYYLCYDNAEKAADTVVKFSEYLRNNLELGKTSDKLISITRELENTKIYSDIEMLRFDEISVEYDIEDDNFEVPALCVQPMVENAIRHGVKGIEGGLVLIKTYETEKDHVIIIKDNGIGYIRTTKHLGKRSHIGVQNVKDRIVRMCGGTFNIEMVKGEGTTVTLTIPKKEREGLPNENISG